MPTGDPPPIPPGPHSSSHASGVSTNEDHTRRNASGTGHSDVDHTMDFSLESHPAPNRSPPSSPNQKLDSPPITLLKKLAANRNNHNSTGKVKLDADMIELLMSLMESEADQKRQLQTMLEEMRHLRQRVQTIEAGQLTRPKPVPVTSYASIIAKQKSKPSPPTKSELVAARPGLTIIHAKVGTNPLKGESAEQIVRKTNEILEKMNAEVQGEQVAVKAIRILPSGDVSFYSKNRQHKEWLNKNKHEWSKQIHSDLEASPSMYQILAHGVPLEFDPASAQGKITLASDNSFLAEKIFKIRWAGGVKDPKDTRKAGSLIITLNDADLADRLVKQRCLWLNSSHHRVERFKRLPPQCFRCLRMGHFSMRCRRDPKCGHCGEGHESTRDCSKEPRPEGKICAICRDDGKERELWTGHTPFDKTCDAKATWLNSKSKNNHE
ncbi:hypothetical protein PSTG_13767 [Puccinia striiformis f. sp. tritici PST-78]|uniref:CCHC-type domain-containing protein n=1 Tax=Puccinia striiformis f. sp. tritici PST-78 TaxID=1165861 RepID=A0A0L0V0P7_9BASI|nr:hypothetical protein PSTG_13767 [Puccinia striiformis f. sp. tritici PST-78]